MPFPRLIFFRKIIFLHFFLFFTIFCSNRHRITIRQSAWSFKLSLLRPSELIAINVPANLETLQTSAFNSELSSPSKMDGWIRIQILAIVSGLLSTGIMAASITILLLVDLHSVGLCNWSSFINDDCLSEMSFFTINFSVSRLLDLRDCFRHLPLWLKRPPFRRSQN